jgi:cytochrome c-type biogenesis protein CcmH
MFWYLVAAMMMAAVLIVAVPLYRGEKRLSTTLILTILVVTTSSAYIYSRIGTPDPGTRPDGQLAEVSEMVASLAARLQENPGDVSGWRMLGRSYFQLRNFPGAIAAFEKAVELESGANGQTLTELGEALLFADQQTLLGRAGELFEKALTIDSNNSKALFYGGMLAVERGDKELGASRWEALLETSPPQNVQEILRQQIAALRGTEAPAPATAIAAAAVVNVNIALGAAVIEAELEEKTVFVIVRDPAQPSPPIAAVRRRLSELPALISLGDADAMIPGRVPSGFARLEIVARVSVSGQAIAASGDWYGQKIIETGTTDMVQITIDQQVP